MPDPKPASRKRDRTRDKLLVAAQELMLERPLASLSIRDITQRAEVVHATFYNYFGSIAALVEGIGLLYAHLHAQTMEHLTRHCSDPAEIVSLSTRQILRFITEVPAYGQMLFDAGLPLDRCLSGLRLTLGRDIDAGIRAGRFRIDETELTIAMLTGSLLGVALDLHRGLLQADAIEAATARLLAALGLPTGEALSLARREATFVTPPKPPLSWLVVESQRQEMAA